MSWVFLLSFFFFSRTSVLGFPGKTIQDGADRLRPRKKHTARVVRELTFFFFISVDGDNKHRRSGRKRPITALVIGLKQISITSHILNRD